MALSIQGNNEIASYIVLPEASHPWTTLLPFIQLYHEGTFSQHQVQKDASKEQAVHAYSLVVHVVC